jgi:uncharacterized Rmd1/YagE family protein
MPKKNGSHYIVEALYVGESIDLKKVQEGLKKYTFLNRDNPLLLEFLPRKYVALTNFGVVVFWNIGEQEQDQFLKDIFPFIKPQQEEYGYAESLDVFKNGGTDRATLKGVYVSSFDPERLKIISYAISQSVALERYENDIETSLEQMGAIATDLKNKGKVSLTEKDVLKQIGKVFTVKQTTISHLSLFDKPEEAWESPELEKLYTILSAEFDLPVRFSVLNRKSEFLSENSRLLMEFLAEKRNAFLEIIIIVLISIELIPLFLEFRKLLFGA